MRNIYPIRGDWYYCYLLSIGKYVIIPETYIKTCPLRGGGMGISPGKYETRGEYVLSCFMFCGILFEPRFMVINYLL